MAVTVFNTLADFNKNTMGLSGDVHSILNGAGTEVINSTAFDYFSDAPSADQTLLFRTNKKFCGVVFNVGTAMDGTPDIVWEYRLSGGTTWATLKVTNKNAIQSTGVQTVTFTPPADWLGPINGRPYWHIRMRLNTVTGITEGGANQTDRIKPLDFGFVVTGTTSNALSNIQTLNNTTAYEILIPTTSTTGLVPIEMPHYALSVDDYIDVILAGTSAGAGDTVDVTGVDVNGASISETLDVSGGDATYTTVKRFKNVTQIDCNGFTDGTVQAKTKTLGLVKSIEHSAFFGCYLTFGDGSTTTTYTITNGATTFAYSYFFWNRIASTLTLGVRNVGGLVNGMDQLGGIFFTAPTPNQFSSGGYLNEGTLTLNGSFIQHYGSSGGYTIVGTLNMNDSKILVGGLTNIATTLTVEGGAELKPTYTLPALSTGLKMDGTINMINDRKKEVVATNLQIEGMNNLNNIDVGRSLTFINSEITSSNISAGGGNLGYVNMQKTFDLIVIDVNGTAIAGATVKIVNLLGETVATLTTDANGAITQQFLLREKGTWINNVLVWVNHTPHTITITKTGYTKKIVEYDMTKTRDEIEVLERSQIQIDQEGGII